MWNAPATLGQGNHIVKVIGYDIGGTPAEVSITVTIGKPCGKASDCAGGQTCVEGRCVAGSDVDGGLGTTCTTNTDCKSGQCGSDGAGNSYCVEVCNPGANGCPSGFGCLEAGGGGVCWPGAGDGGGCSAGSGSAEAGFLSLGLGALLITRRRRRR